MRGDLCGVDVLWQRGGLVFEAHMDSCISQLMAQGPSGTCNESKEEEEAYPKKLTAAWMVTQKHSTLKYAPSTVDPHRARALEGVAESQFYEERESN